jgi:acyl-CoA dehydrogenase
VVDTRDIRAFLDERHLALASILDTFVAQQIAPLGAPEDDDAARVQARVIAQRLGEAGLLAALDPLDLRALCLTREALAAVSPLADATFALQGLGSMPLILTPGAAPRDGWLARVRAGDAIAAFAMTEPEAGSDVAAIATRARPSAGGYRLDGEKTLISNAGIADFYCVFAATDPSAGHRGLSCFVVDAETPGLRFAGPLRTSEPHPLGELRFEGCEVPASARLGAEGAGFSLGMAALDRLRPTVGAAACGMATRALDEALGHAGRRRQFGKPLGEQQLIQQKLARMATELCAARLLVYRAAWERDRGKERITLEAAMAKSFATEAAQRIVDDAVQIHGGIGVLADHPVDRLYRAVRALRIYEGTSEIQSLIIARELIRERS